MDKIAQKRTVWNKLREMTNVSGKAAEKFFNPEFQKVMVSLRKIDNNIRSIVAGVPMGTEKDPYLKEDVAGNPGHDKISCKQLIKSAKSNLNRMEYLKAVSDLGRFHAKMAEVASQIKELDTNVNAVHEQFIHGHLTKDRDDETPEEFNQRMEYLENLKKLKSRLAAERRAELIKQAGIMDFFVNIGTTRGRALSAWEKRYPKQTKALKEETGKQVAAAEKLLELTIEILKSMASARSVRDPDSYLGHATELKHKYEAYDAGFKVYYTTHIKGFLEKMFPGGSPSAAPEKPAAPGSMTVPDLALPEKNLATPTLPSAGPASTQTPAVPDLVFPDRTTAPAMPPGASPPFAPPPAESAPSQQTPEVPDLPALPAPAATPTLPAAAPAPAPAAVAPAAKKPRKKKDTGGADDEDYADFYDTLETMSGESPLVMASFINRFARSIQQTDPDTAIKLFSIVKSIKG